MEKALGLSLALALFLASPACAQESETPNTASTAPPSLTSSTPNQSFSDNAGYGNNNDDDHDTGMGGLVHYYFVFLALIILVAGLSAFLVWRRKKRMGLVAYHHRESALERDLSAWDPMRARRRYWQGRWRSADTSHEEGLNEHGEAPPPYMPKSRDENNGEEAVGSGPAVPLQTLSRDQAGLKPPDYTESHTRPVYEGELASSQGVAASQATGLQRVSR